MTCLRLCSLLVLTAALATTAPAIAQGPPAPPPGAQPGGPGQARGPQLPPTNLKVLPKDISRDDLIKLMHGYEGDLGVECAFCHAQNPTTHRNDFASDANPVKDKARIMIAMTDEINTKYLAQLANRKPTDSPVTCGTCHRGEEHPTTFVPVPRPRPAGAPPAPGAGPAAPPAAPH
jgi:Photosynthetic reaction centre cytochrome C subunit